MEKQAAVIETAITEVDTREKIVDAAIGLFSSKGYEAASMREISEVVGIRKSSIYSHFRKKEDILESILRYFRAEVGKAGIPAASEDETIATLLKDFGPAGLMSTAGSRLSDSMGSPRMQMIWRMISIEMCRNAMIRSFFQRQMIDQPLRFWEKAFRAMVAQGMIPAGDPAVLAREFYAFQVYLYLKYLLLGCDADFESLRGDADRESAEHARFFLERLKK